MHKKVANWSTYNLDLLKRSFVNDSVAKAYAQIIGPIRERLKARIEFLDSVLQRLHLVDEQIDETQFSTVEVPPTGEIFLVHGHDEAANEAVSRFTERLGLKVVRLSEQPHKGRTLIEKLEDYGNVSYAIALLTPDDLASPIEKAQNQEEWKPRARQNTIFELGIFVGKLGRGKVCILYKPGVEIPSDYRGVGYIEMEPRGNWKVELAREMKAAGLGIDLNNVA